MTLRLDNSLPIKHWKAQEKRRKLNRSQGSSVQERVFQLVISIGLNINHKNTIDKVKNRKMNSGP